MKKLISILLLSACSLIGQVAATQQAVYSNADGTIRSPANFFTANASRDKKLEIADFTAVKGMTHVVIGTVTATDFSSPSSGDSYSVNVISGTATLGGTVYPAGSQVFRAWVSGAWVNFAVQPLDSDLTSIAGLSTTAYGRSFLDRADAPAARTYLGFTSSTTGFPLLDITVSGGAQAVPTYNGTIWSSYSAQPYGLSLLSVPNASSLASQVAGAANGTWDISISGNAATATRLATARTISLSGDASGSASFDGTGNITIAAVVADNSHDHTKVKSLGNLLAEDTTTRNVHSDGVYTFNVYGATLGDTSPNTFWSVIGFGNGQSGAAQIATEWSNGGNNLWFRSLRDVTDNWWDWKRVYHDGYRPNANKWTSARTLSLSGDLSGSVSFDGSANFTLSATVADSSHNHTISTIDGLQPALDLKAPLASPTFTGVLNAANVSVNSTGYLQLPSTAQTSEGRIWYLGNRVAYRDGTSTNRELVDLSIAQTLSNKTLTAPILGSTASTADGAVWYTGGAINYSVSGSTKTVVSTDQAQTLTNKTLNLASNTLSATSGQLATALSDETGSGSVVFSNSPTLTGNVTLPSTTSVGSVTAAQLQFVSGVTSSIQTQLNSKLNTTTAASTYQPLDLDLTSFAALQFGGIVARSEGSNVFTRTITGGTGVTVTNGDGLIGNPTIAIGQPVATTSNVTFNSARLNSGLLSVADATLTIDGAGSGWGNLVLSAPYGQLYTAAIGFPGPGLTDSRYYTFPDSSGYIALNSVNNFFYAQQTFSAGIITDTLVVDQAGAYPSALQVGDLYSIPQFEYSTTGGSGGLVQVGKNSMADNSPAMRVNSVYTTGLVASSVQGLGAKVMQTPNSWDTVQSPVFQVYRSGSAAVSNPGDAAVVVISDSTNPMGQGGSILRVYKSGDIVFAIDNGGNPVLRAPNGTYFRILVDSAGALSTQSIIAADF